MARRKLPSRRDGRSSQKWFKPKGHSGFRKRLSVKDNLVAMGIKVSSPRYMIRRRLRQVNALANVTQDSSTERRARAVVKRLSYMLIRSS